MRRLDMRCGRRRSKLASADDFFNLRAIERFVLEQRLGDEFKFIQIGRDDILGNVVCLIEVYWILKILIFRWDMLKLVVAGGVASIVGLLLLRVIHVGYGYQAIFGALGLVIPFMLVYGLVLTVLRFSKEDMMVFDAVRAKIDKKKLV